MTNKWKVAAIIFIIIAVLEALLIVYFWNIGTEMIENENECMYNICSEAEAFIYYDTEKVCECYTDNIIVKTEYMK